MFGFFDRPGLPSFCEGEFLSATMVHLGAVVLGECYCFLVWVFFDFVLLILFFVESSFGGGFGRAVDTGSCRP